MISDTLASSSRAEPGALIWILMINHRHGINVYPCCTREGADHQLLEYVRENWKRELFDYDKGKAPRMPKDPARAIECYFEAVYDEIYDITEESLLP